MGSSGSGRFGTYRIGDEGGVKGDKTGDGINGTGEVGCPELIENVRLEDVATSEFYTMNHMLPAVNSQVTLRNKINLGRLVIETSDTNEVIGNLPTNYNYLLNCIKSGLHYSGKVISSGVSPVPFVVVSLSA